MGGSINQTDGAITITFFDPIAHAKNIYEKAININASNYSIIIEENYTLFGVQGAECTSSGTNEPIIT